ncbi:FAD-dependent oxidoreductase [Halobacteria archaeon AArc-curdl1]|uniref:FAD-dependent oxidoreductase n=1 Tax=Natronosalvus hydrolyticus TaxID=2979988 RepID=A0AAP2Z6K1_9EURY|nr:FAD-dependent oxidoreductase [Halobacteria archaeon AArc-curdl1]
MIGVVGDSLSGLVCAYRLARAGYDVSVFAESTVDAMPAHAWPTARLHPSDSSTRSLLADLGFEHRLAWDEARIGFYDDGTIHPFNTRTERAAHPRLSLRETVRLEALFAGIARDGDARLGISRSIPIHPEDYDDVPLKSHLESSSTEQTAAAIWTPVLEGRFGAGADALSAAPLLEWVRRRRETRRRGVLEGGGQSLVDALVAEIGTEKVRARPRVTDVVTEAGSLQSVRLERNGELTTQPLEALVIATGPESIGRLTEYDAGIETVTPTFVTISTTRALTGCHEVFVADSAPFDRIVTPTTIDSRADDRTVHTMVRYARSNESSAESAPPADLERRWLAALGELFPPFDRGGLESVETTTGTTKPITSRGYLERVVPYDLETAVADGVFYAGTASRATYPELRLEGAVAAGDAGAERVMAALEPAERPS